jgi:hypothetical protein
VRRCYAEGAVIIIMPNCSGGGNVVVASLELELRSFHKNPFKDGGATTTAA